MLKQVDSTDKLNPNEIYKHLSMLQENQLLVEFFVVVLREVNIWENIVTLESLNHLRINILSQFYSIP